MMDRKKFIVSSGMAVFAMSTFGRAIKSPEGFKGDCETTKDILGPFYRENAPKRQDLTYDGLKGVRFQIKGTVFTDDCTTPIKDTLVEIWHCNSDGDYDNKSNEYRQRASWATNKKGVYGFKTILLGKYLNGRLYRPAHVHFRVTAPGHKELISQIYFAGDPHITEDPWASQKKAEHRILQIIPEDTKGSLVVNFDIYLGTE